MIIWGLLCAYSLSIGCSIIIHWLFTWIWLFDVYLWQEGEGEKQHIIYNRPQGVASSPSEGGFIGRWDGVREFMGGRGK